MIGNVILGLLALGWTVNTAVFMVRRQAAYTLLNWVLSAVAMTWLLVRLS